VEENATEGKKSPLPVRTFVWAMFFQSWLGGRKKSHTNLVICEKPAALCSREEVFPARKIEFSRGETVWDAEAEGRGETAGTNEQRPRWSKKRKSGRPARFGVNSSQHGEIRYSFKESGE